MRKNKAELARVEILPAAPRTEADFKQQLARFIEERVAEAMSGGDAPLQPWFQTREIAFEIKRRQTVAQQHRFSDVFREHGCLDCKAKNAAHGSCGLCPACYQRFSKRLKAAERARTPSSEAQPTFVDSMRLAREALVLPTDAAQKETAIVRRKR